ncbi:MAG: L,D-transpeptidase family protein [Propionibacteriaceae bacterium]
MARCLATVATLAVLIVSGCATNAANSSSSDNSSTLASQSSSATSAATDAPKPSPSATSTPTPTPTPTVHYVLMSGALDPLVKEVQARLRQLNLFGYYDVIETYGPATTEGVSGFQQSIGVEATGNLDDKTWETLRAKTQQPSSDELSNLVPGPVVLGEGATEDIKNLQHRLQQLQIYGGGLDGTFSQETVNAVAVFQTNQGIAKTGNVDQRTIDRLWSVTRQPTPNELRGDKTPMGGFYQELDSRCLKGRVICASMGQSRVSWVVDGTVLLTIEARYGSTKYPTYPGVFKVWLKDANAVSTIFGEKIPMPYTMFFDQDRGVHYSEYFRRDGWFGTSHGCVNVRDYESVKWLYSQVNLGDTVVVY